MRIGLIADTHIPSAGKQLPPQVAWAFKGLDLILHAGDIHILAVLDWLQAIAPVLAARGNGDRDLPADPRLNETRVVEAEGLRIGLSHGLLLPEDPPWRTLSKIMDREFGGRVDVYVFGDTHVDMVETHDGVLMINPGSPTLPHNLVGRLGTVGLLEIVDGKAHARIIQLK